jgi:spore coat polysaccharide biosynthesis protein SpsF
MNRSIVIVQARTGSKRFPYKVLADLCGKPVLWHVLSRALEIKGKQAVVLAVPDEGPSDNLANLARAMGVKVWKGPEDDVLTRFVGAARKENADYIMRITADCPLIDPDVCSQVLEAAKTPGIDYASNVMPRTFEKGLDCEAFTRWALELTNKRALIAYDREHVTPLMQLNKIFKRINVESGDPSRAEKNWCVDYPEDLERVRLVMEWRQAS